MRDDDYKAFLEHFPAPKRSLIMNQFCDAYRKGNRSVDSILETVMVGALKRCESDSVSDIEIQRTLYNLCALDDLAPLMAEYVIWWEELDAKTKNEIKQARQSGYVNSHMAVQPPSPRQLKYLEVLGCKKIPKSKLEASNLIEECLNGKRNQVNKGAS